jgi:hypothetical protein
VTVRPCRDHTPAAWITDDRRPWHRLVTLGPSGFDAYARLLFLPDPAAPGQWEADVESENTAARETNLLQRVIRELTPRTNGPEHLFFAVWDGWGFQPVDGPASAWSPVAERDYHLFSGASDDLGDQDAWSAAIHHPTSLAATAPDPAFVWPPDRAWCLTRDVDAHFATVAASAEVIDRLLTLPGLDLVPTSPDQDPPRYL